MLPPYPLLELNRSTYVTAAQLRACCAKGVNAEPIDFQITASCCQYGFPLPSADQDFAHIAKHCDLVPVSA